MLLIVLTIMDDNFFDHSFLTHCQEQEDMFAVLAATLTVGNIEVNTDDNGDAVVKQNCSHIKTVTVSWFIFWSSDPLVSCHNGEVIHWLLVISYFQPNHLDL